MLVQVQCAKGGYCANCAMCYLHPAAPHVRHSRVTPAAANDLAGAFARVAPRWPTLPDLSAFSTFGHPFSRPAPIGPKSNQVWFSAPWHGTTWATWQTWVMSKEQAPNWAVDQMAPNWNPHWRQICLFRQGTILCHSDTLWKLFGTTPNQNLPWCLLTIFGAKDTGCWLGKPPLLKMDEFLDKKLWKGGGRGVISNKNCSMFWKKL